MKYLIMLGMLVNLAFGGSMYVGVGNTVGWDGQAQAIGTDIAQISIGNIYNNHGLHKITFVPYSRTPSGKEGFGVNGDENILLNFGNISPYIGLGAGIYWNYYLSLNANMGFIYDLTSDFEIDVAYQRKIYLYDPMSDNLCVSINYKF